MPKNIHLPKIIIILSVLAGLIVVSLLSTGSVQGVRNYIVDQALNIYQTVNNDQVETSPVIESAQLNKGIVETSDDPSFGADRPELVVVEFADFTCPYCRAAYQDTRAIMLEYQDRVKFIFRDLPAYDARPNSYPAALAGECAQEQGSFWQLHDKLFQNQDKISYDYIIKLATELNLDEKSFKECIDQEKFKLEISNDIADAVKLDVRGTPTWFVDGYKYEGAIPKETFEEILDYHLSL